MSTVECPGLPLNAGELAASGSRARLPPDALGYVQALVRGRTLKQHALEELGVPVWQVNEVASHARKLLGRPPTPACLVRRAPPQLLGTAQTPVEEPRTELQPARRVHNHAPGPASGPGPDEPRNAPSSSTTPR
jgi:hypothetical protein